MLETYEQLKTLVASVEDDLRKAAGGNKAAGTRVRKMMQDVKNVAQDATCEGARKSRRRLIACFGMFYGAVRLINRADLTC